ncbi:MAG: type III pantothenate kinase [Rikenellaceae bacterium]|nr:type III pantothenate kinase [Rikenellaceae bacterium]
MNIAVDIGNSSAKVAVYKNYQSIFTVRWSISDLLTELTGLFLRYPGIVNSIISSTCNNYNDIAGFLKRNTEYFIDFNYKTPVPLVNKYKTPHTLGPDRLASAVGGASLFPGENLVIFDFGTAITIDIVTQSGEFMGGNISPGLSMRFKALNAFTDKLPLKSQVESYNLIGEDTDTAIIAGVQNSVIFEINGYIKEITEKYKEIKVLFTGGDGNYFAKRVKNPIFANCDLVVYGLNNILEYNVQNKN